MKSQNSGHIYRYLHKAQTCLSTAPHADWTTTRPGPRVGQRGREDSLHAWANQRWMLILLDALHLPQSLINTYRKNKSQNYCLGPSKTILCSPGLCRYGPTDKTKEGGGRSGVPRGGLYLWPVPVDVLLNQHNMVNNYPSVNIMKFLKRLRAGCNLSKVKPRGPTVSGTSLPRGWPC